MKGLRFLLLSMAICLASGVKAQFYDSADDIYYYVQCDKYGQITENGKVLVFNFDGRTACELTGLMEYEGIGIRTFSYVEDVKKRLRKSLTYFEDKTENTDYNLCYASSGTGTTYTGSFSFEYSAPMGTVYATYEEVFNFSSKRENLEHKETRKALQSANFSESKATETNLYKKVDKSFFKVGRSRTPSGTMHE